MKNIAVEYTKGFGILCMILAHVGFGSFINSYIHSFHMPLFFIMSGYVASKSSKTTMGYVVKRTKRLIKPYMLVELFYLVIATLFGCKEQFVDYLCSILWNNSSGLPIAGAPWFLTAMYFSSLIFFLLSKYCSEPMTMALSVVFAGTGFLLSTYNIILPWSLDAAFIGVGYIAVGHFMALHQHCIERKLSTGGQGLCLLTLVIQMFLQFLNGEINLRTNEYGKSAILSFILASVAVFSYFFIFERCAKNDGFGHIAHLCKSLFLFLSSRSLIFMLFNEFIIKILKAAMLTVFQPVGTISVLLCNSFVAVLAFIVLFVVSEVIRKTTLNNIFV